MDFGVDCVHGLNRAFSARSLLHPEPRALPEATDEAALSALVQVDRDLRARCLSSQLRRHYVNIAPGGHNPPTPVSLTALAQNLISQIDPGQGGWSSQACDRAFLIFSLICWQKNGRSSNGHHPN